MRKIRIMEHMSLDGVIESPGGKEDGDFKYAGWSMQYVDKVIGDGIVAAHGTGYDLLLGRRTYDGFAAYWPKAESGAIADGFNAATKYVATHRPESLEWGPAKDLGTDIIAGVRALKAQDGPELIIWGSPSITSLLLEQGLVDEVVLIVYPVLLGNGKRFFSDNVDASELALADTKAGESGAMINTYKYVGALSKAKN
ncbi:dihydrofolate reductase [Mucilaginibacter terrigena]|uniref:Dihydrofolate reductase n=1 Tax=Mucilaginibacter terrigena TaxID=2492395 RepID=A0A4Q5LSD0_9SPHI|nr:dihydrofolate reductase family protein [Mucilaginibacter terrigena]RYU92395.1 dihydrofolate reductase [Mucilaginibacter terrigena]